MISCLIRAVDEWQQLMIFLRVFDQNKRLACSVVQNTQVSRDNFVFQNGSRGDVNSISVIRDNYDCALQEKDNDCEQKQLLDFL